MRFDVDYEKNLFHINMYVVYVVRGVSFSLCSTSKILPA